MAICKGPGISKEGPFLLAQKKHGSAPLLIVKNGSNLGQQRNGCVLHYDQSVLNNNNYIVEVLISPWCFFWATASFLIGGLLLHGSVSTVPGAHN